MSVTSLILISFGLLLGASATPLNGTGPRASCTVTSFDQVDTAISSCSDIVISGITVPAGQKLYLNLKDGTKVTFEGTIKFDYSEWEGPLIHVKGNAITVQGSTEHRLDGQGDKYWDGGGDNGKTKPKFFYIQATGFSEIKNIHLFNCPKQCVAISDSSDLTLNYWSIDSSVGDELGRNTDGFDLSKVDNTTACCINDGSNLVFSNLRCYGGHGLSLAVGQDKTSSSGNIVSNVVFKDLFVINSRNGIHIKTQPDAANGSITGLTYQDIKMSGITYYAINIEEDYEGSGPTGNLRATSPLLGLTISGITATMTGEHSTPVYILCGDGGCSDWSWQHFH
ncbi:hypothetical protein NQ318_007131 [Aromia moschata]|uniref:Endopolygalacturonase n=1 Tax=Aromia moschata TaxID=1265417 RepID=A0AAV8X3G3_9CUCU|nr:hypothetical protein NQ318_007131 [Aromia moschata]